MLAENIRDLGQRQKTISHSNWNIQSITIFLSWPPKPQFPQDNVLKIQWHLYTPWWQKNSALQTVNMAAHCTGERHYFPSKAVCYMNTLGKILQKKGLCSQNMQKCEKPMKNCLPTLTASRLYHRYVSSNITFMMIWFMECHLMYLFYYAKIF